MMRWQEATIVSNNDSEDVGSDRSIELSRLKNLQTNSLTMKNGRLNKMIVAAGISPRSENVVVVDAVTYYSTGGAAHRQQEEVHLGAQRRSPLGGSSKGLHLRGEIMALTWMDIGVETKENAEREGRWVLWAGHSSGHVVAILVVLRCSPSPTGERNSFSLAVDVLASTSVAVTPLQLASSHFGDVYTSPHHTPTKLESQREEPEQEEGGTKALHHGVFHSGSVGTINLSGAVRRNAPPPQHRSESGFDPSQHANRVIFSVGRSDKCLLVYDIDTVVLRACAPQQPFTNISLLALGVKTVMDLDEEPTLQASSPLQFVPSVGAVPLCSSISFMSPPNASQDASVVVNTIGLSSGTVLSSVRCPLFGSHNHLDDFSTATMQWFNSVERRVGVFDPPTERNQHHHTIESLPHVVGGISSAGDADTTMMIMLNSTSTTGAPMTTQDGDDGRAGGPGLVAEVWSRLELEQQLIKFADISSTSSWGINDVSVLPTDTDAAVLKTSMKASVGIDVESEDGSPSPRRRRRGQSLDSMDDDVVLFGGSATTQLQRKTVLDVIQKPAKEESEALFDEELVHEGDCQAILQFVISTTKASWLLYAKVVPKPRQHRRSLALQYISSFPLPAHPASVTLIHSANNTSLDRLTPIPHTLATVFVGEMKIVELMESDEEVLRDASKAVAAWHKERHQSKEDNHGGAHTPSSAPTTPVQESLSVVPTTTETAREVAALSSQLAALHRSYDALRSSKNKSQDLLLSKIETLQVEAATSEVMIEELTTTIKKQQRVLDHHHHHHTAEEMLPKNESDREEGERHVSPTTVDVYDRGPLFPESSISPNHHDQSPMLVENNGMHRDERNRRPVAKSHEHSGHQIDVVAISGDAFSTSVESSPISDQKEGTAGRSGTDHDLSPSPEPRHDKLQMTPQGKPKHVVVQQSGSSTNLVATQRPTPLSQVPGGAFEEEAEEEQRPSWTNGFQLDSQLAESLGMESTSLSPGSPSGVPGVTSPLRTKAQMGSASGSFQTSHSHDQEKPTQEQPQPWKEEDPHYRQLSDQDDQKLTAEPSGSGGAGLPPLSPNDSRAAYQQYTTGDGEHQQDDGSFYNEDSGRSGSVFADGTSPSSRSYSHQTQVGQLDYMLVDLLQENFAIGVFQMMELEEQAWQMIHQWHSAEMALLTELSHTRKRKNKMITEEEKQKLAVGGSLEDQLEAILVQIRERDDLEMTADFLPGSSHHRHRGASSAFRSPSLELLVSARVNETLEQLNAAGVPPPTSETPTKEGSSSARHQESANESKTLETQVEEASAVSCSSSSASSFEQHIVEEHEEDAPQRRISPSPTQPVVSQDSTLMHHQDPPPSKSVHRGDAVVLHHHHHSRRSSPKTSTSNTVYTFATSPSPHAAPLSHLATSTEEQRKQNIGVIDEGVLRFMMNVLQAHEAATRDAIAHQEEAERLRRVVIPRETVFASMVAERFQTAYDRKREAHQETIDQRELLRQRVREREGHIQFLEQHLEEIVRVQQDREKEVDGLRQELKMREEKVAAAAEPEVRETAGQPKGEEGGDGLHARMKLLTEQLDDTVLPALEGLTRNMKQAQMPPLAPTATSTPPSTSSPSFFAATSSSSPLPPPETLLPQLQELSACCSMLATELGGASEAIFYHHQALQVQDQAASTHQQGAANTAEDGRRLDIAVASTAQQTNTPISASASVQTMPQLEHPTQQYSGENILRGASVVSDEYHEHVDVDAMRTPPAGTSQRSTTREQEQLQHSASKLFAHTPDGAMRRVELLTKIQVLIKQNEALLGALIAAETQGFTIPDNVTSVLEGGFSP